ncbi:hypothetical protein EMIHUDRAFT_212115 [Emiliania huxleyi CCMP1516]|uniref:FAD linked oxidase N-terminal domain-containing protein n=2 Tax=Emiliania huxleyi TaxID=2903 RepID=A0A0D3IS77_EMIH1|nr:hypothetical protein EMIHUDRAFT_212115 [Emiliania huxleyi CCMP1516]EOD14112.1 hypothetical protein EMIHUDRAFT_212115 [Emiliania huxleyi CCMP1516]|eukprot:XP_005766541.1 hypothetical protein EMIHUDRAFT_212115 [Emiliania huxleyi CCMP1516]
MAFPSGVMRATTCTRPVVAYVAKDDQNYGSANCACDAMRGQLDVYFPKEDFNSYKSAMSSINNHLTGHAEPPCVVLPTSEGDVINAVKISNKHKAKVTVMGGGHSAVSSSDLAILISMKVPAMQSINFEPLYSRVRGVTLITPDGEKHELSESSQGNDADLWWGVRGAAPQLGIVTSVTIETRTLPDPYRSLFSLDAIALPMKTLLMKNFLEQSATAPDDTSLNMVVGVAMDKNKWQWQRVQAFYATGNGLVQWDPSCTCSACKVQQSECSKQSAEPAQRALNTLLKESGEAEATEGYTCDPESSSHTYYTPGLDFGPHTGTKSNRLTKVYSTPDYLVNALDFAFPPLDFAKDTSDASKFFGAGSVDKRVFWGKPPSPDLEPGMALGGCQPPLYKTTCRSYLAFEIQSIIIKLNDPKSSSDIAQLFYDALIELGSYNTSGKIESANIALQHTGGNVEKTDSSSMAYFNRKQDWGCSITCAYYQDVKDPQSADNLSNETTWDGGNCADWVAALVDKLDPKGVYIVDTKPWVKNTEWQVKRAFGDNLDRLCKLKHEVDTKNMFGGAMLDGCPR